MSGTCCSSVLCVAYFHMVHKAFDELAATCLDLRARGCTELVQFESDESKLGNERNGTVEGGGIKEESRSLGSGEE